MKINTNNNVNFGIYKWTKYTNYGYQMHGEYKKNNIDIYQDTKDNAKLFYISDVLGKWIKSKLMYFNKGKQKTVIQERVD